MTEPIIAPRLLSVEEAAQVLGIGKTTLQQLARARLVPFRRIGGGRNYKFAPEDIDRIIEQSLVETVRRSK